MRPTAEVDLKKPTSATYQGQVHCKACLLALEKCFQIFNLKRQAPQCQQACLVVDLHLIVSSSLLLHVF